MLTRTHLAISIFFILLFFPLFDNKIVFCGVMIVSTLLPDIDSSHSKLGKNFLLRPLQFFFGHRGILHSFTFALMISVLVFFFSQEASIAFFFGYGLHLLADSLTVMGITPFYPISKKWKGVIKTGGWSEAIIFMILILADIALLVFRLPFIFNL
ncbi:MAG TPA: metal-dependent hydrolase [Candidatus Pacearchaeota archaeon]|nr:metal-dependent hydrolase [Candidatus Pacearchaeota archaeon]